MVEKEKVVEKLFHGEVGWAREVGEKEVVGKRKGGQKKDNGRES